MDFDRKPGVESSILLTQHYISVLGFFLKQPSTVKVAIDKSHFRVLAGNSGAFIAIANKARDVKLGMGVSYRIEGVAADVSCRPGTTIRGSVDSTNYGRQAYMKILGAAIAEFVSSNSENEGKLPA